MIPGLTSVIIPAYNAEATIAAAVDSALAQTCPVEVIVVDDGSKDGTARAANAAHVVISKEQGGVAAARNWGLSQASGEFIQFLDADDTIESTKVELSLARMDADAGWVICDTRIIEVSGAVQLASERYHYATRHIDGWIAPQLGVKNFIPIHAALFRRSAIGDIRFPEDRAPEDWHFLFDVAQTARVRYTPAILATYRKRREGRNATTPKEAKTRPGVAEPLRLNLGCGTPGAPSWHPMPGFVNLDKQPIAKFRIVAKPAAVKK